MEQGERHRKKRKRKGGSPLSVWYHRHRKQARTSRTQERETERAHERGAQESIHRVPLAFIDRSEEGHESDLGVRIRRKDLLIRFLVDRRSTSVHVLFSIEEVSWLVLEKRSVCTVLF